MTTAPFRIAVVAPATPLDRDLADRISALVSRLYPDGRCDLSIHPQCFLSEGHFAGPDEARAQAFVEAANDPGFDAVWFARGGYGAVRILDLALPRLTAAARRKTYMGYSDIGFILGALYRLGFPRLAHGPMPTDLRRPGGEAALARALQAMVEGDAAGIEPGVTARPVAAFNLTILCHLLGTPWVPDLAGHDLLLEEVSEPYYRIDRCFAQIAAALGPAGLAGIRLGRCSDILANSPDFAMDEEEIAETWCRRLAIPYLGRADIGHDAHNRIVPFGRWRLEDRTGR